MCKSVDEAKKYTLRCYPSKERDKQVIDILNGLDKSTSYRDFICDAILFYHSHNSRSVSLNDIDEKLDILKEQILAEIKDNLGNIAVVSVDSESSVATNDTNTETMLEDLGDTDSIPDNALDFLLGI